MLNAAETSLTIAAVSFSSPFLLPSPDGGEIHGIVTTAEHDGPRPTVVICHGFKGFMEWGFFPHIADLLASRGFTAVRFNFTGGGMRPGDDLVTDLAAFATATIGNDVCETEAVIGALLDGRIAGGTVDRDRIGLFGHSRGGGTSVLTAAASGHVAALVTWSAVADFDRTDATAKQLWREKGGLPVVNARTGQELSIAIEVLDDLEANREAYDLGAAASRIVAPWLIVHGGDDETVSIDDARSLEQSAAGTVVLLEIDGASHTLGVQHPFAGPTPQLITAMNATQSWFRNNL